MSQIIVRAGLILLAVGLIIVGNGLTFAPGDAWNTPMLCGALAGFLIGVTASYGVQIKTILRDRRARWSH